MTLSYRTERPKEPCMTCALCIIMIDSSIIKVQFYTKHLSWALLNLHRMTDNNQNIRKFYLPPGVYFIFNPYQKSHGVVAKLAGAVQNSLDVPHSCLHPIYDVLRHEQLDSIFLVVSGLVQHTNTMELWWAHSVMMQRITRNNLL